MKNGCCYLNFYYFTRDFYNSNTISTFIPNKLFYKQQASTFNNYLHNAFKAWLAARAVPSSSLFIPSFYVLYVIKHNVRISSFKIPFCFPLFSHNKWQYVPQNNHMGISQRACIISVLINNMLIFFFILLRVIEVEGLCKFASRVRHINWLLTKRNNIL